MKYSSYIDNVTATEWGLTIHQAYLFDWIYSLPSWADKVTIENEVFFFASRTRAIDELKLLTDKPDTMYRYYKQLEELGLIVLKKVDGKDYISLTKKAKTWGRTSGKKSDSSEKNPTESGNISESDSEKNPTYKIISIDKITNDNVFDIFDEIQKKYFPNSKKIKRTPSRSNQINARLSEGYQTDDFRSVFDLKFKMWKGTEWQRFLTIDTFLQPSKFSKYFDEASLKSTAPSENIELTPSGFKSPFEKRNIHA